MLRTSEADTDAQLSDENMIRGRDALCQQLMAIVDETELQYGPDCGANVVLDACLEIETGHRRDIVHMMVDATYDRLADKPRKPSRRAH
jgi:hypothetical protein